MSNYDAFGTLLQQGDGGATEVFTTVAQVMDISGPALSADTADVTSHSSTGGYEEAVATVLRTGEVTFSIAYDPAAGTHDASTGILADYEAKTLRNWQLVFPDDANTTWSFSAFVTGFQPQEPVAGALTADLTLKLSGQPTLA